MDRLLAIVGPTASGKSNLAVALAQRFEGEIINADSRQFYRGMDIGTAKPTLPEQAVAPHHLLDFLDPVDSFSLASFLSLARGLVRAINARGRLPILAGGTGQYVWGLLEGWQVPEVPPNQELRSRLEEELEENGIDVLARRLQEADPLIAAQTDLRNPRRVIRALERLASDVRSDRSRRADRPPFDSLVLGVTLDRANLHERIRDRIDGMIANGWKREVEALLRSGVAIDAPAMSAIGYREMALHVRGEISLQEARHKAIVATNRLVRHQGNWFKMDDPRIRWIDGSAQPVTEAVQLVTDWIEHRPPSPSTPRDER